ncbi:hypothetical protein ANTHELSMS3_05070 (plasmid) [Antarctobacter heliothermus]|uniref:Uncharacterized protein n=1 Tax=Antarctobacter heliothermus TaxID=74033 RepID=A0A222EBG7_9RHOB|nr:hypothetical protein [Antarctobacter heliothermus]ASP23450.1 hypothetical protein ANTHELSMS3_05070 [Antarctobacter heliothermus]
MSKIKNTKIATVNFCTVAILAFSAVSATAGDTPSGIARTINSVAPEVSVGSLSHAEIASLMNVITSSESESKARTTVINLAKKYSDN